MPKKNVLIQISLMLFLLSCQAQQQKNTLTVNGNMQKVDGIVEGFTCGMVDNKGVLWFGTNAKGLYRYDGQSFTNYTEEDGLSNNRITSLIQDDEGNLWMGTFDGLCKFDLSLDAGEEEAFTYVHIPFDGNEDLWGPGMNARKVLSLVQDVRGDIWFGTWGAGAYRFNPTTLGSKEEMEFTAFLTNAGRVQSDGLYKNVIQSITEDKEGNLWFPSMTHGGISRYNPEAEKKGEPLFSHFTLDHGLEDDMITTSFLARNGDLWFGSLGNRDGGLHHYKHRKDELDKGNKKLFKNYNVKDGLCNNNVWDICEDVTGNIWVASGRGDLCVFNPRDASFSAFTSPEGNTFSGIRFVLADDQKNVWFGGEFGQLYCYNGKEVFDFT